MLSMKEAMDEILDGIREKRATFGLAKISEDAARSHEVNHQVVLMVGSRRIVRVKDGHIIMAGLNRTGLEDIRARVDEMLADPELP